VHAFSDPAPQRSYCPNHYLFASSIAQNANPSENLQGCQSCPFQLSKFTSNRHFTPIAGHDATHPKCTSFYIHKSFPSPTKWFPLPYYVRSTSLPSLSAHHRPTWVALPWITISPQRRDSSPVRAQRRSIPRYGKSAPTDPNRHRLRHANHGSSQV